MIANRFKEVLDLCIDKAQSGFAPERLISKYILLAYEILHTFRQKHLGRKGFMALKLDMSKVYDRVEWSFLKDVMSRMAFTAKWIDLIMRCISLVSYSVLINGKVEERFHPT